MHSCVLLVLYWYCYTHSTTPTTTPLDCLTMLLKFNADHYQEIGQRSQWWWLWGHSKTNRFHPTCSATSSDILLSPYPTLTWSTPWRGVGASRRLWDPSRSTYSSQLTNSRVYYLVYPVDSSILSNVCVDAITVSHFCLISRYHTYTLTSYPPHTHQLTCVLSYIPHKIMCHYHHHLSISLMTYNCLTVRSASCRYNSAMPPLTTYDYLVVTTPIFQRHPSTFTSLPFTMPCMLFTTISYHISKGGNLLQNFDSLLQLCGIYHVIFDNQSLPADVLRPCR